MTIVLTIIHVLVSFFLILVVLAQQGKGQDLASAFGGGGSAAAFGARGAATFLSKVTTIAAAIFMLTSLGLTYLSPRGTGDRTVVPDAPPASGAPASPGVSEPAPGSTGPSAETSPDPSQAPAAEEAPPPPVSTTPESSTPKKQEPPKQP